MDTLRISLSPEARALLDALAEIGAQPLLVGGAVRDALLGTPVRDLDIVSRATVASVLEVAREAGWTRSVYSMGERYGTAGVVLVDGTTVEISQLRGEGVRTGDPATAYEADAMLRDFTVDAIAATWPGLAILDPLGGREDLAAGLLRSPGRPLDRFADDPLRVLRLARLSAQFDFDAEGRTVAGAAECVALGGLERVAVERIRDELTKLLVSQAPHRGLALAVDTAALSAVLPEVDALRGVEQPGFHDKDVMGRTVEAVGLVPTSEVLRWAALLHDIGKPSTRSVDETGRIRFLGHARVGAVMTEAIAERLRFSSAQARAVRHLVAEHLRLGQLDTDNAPAVDRAVRRLDLRAHAGAHAPLLVSAEDALELELADLGATAHRSEVSEARRRLGAAIAASRERGTSAAPRSPVSGKRLMHEFGIGAGPLIGAMQRAIVAEIVAGHLDANDDEGALRVAGDVARRGGVGSAP
jgi:poly(A) polymerase